MVFTISDSVDVRSNNGDEREAKVWKQLLQGFLASLPFFMHGVTTTELTSSAHSGHFISSPRDVPWPTRAMILAAIISAPIFYYLTEKYGKKSGVYLVNLAQGACCIPIFLPQTEISSIILHVIAGVSTSGLFIVLPAYVKEISDDRIRGVNLALMPLLTTAGYLLYLVVDLEAMMFVMFALVAAQFLSMMMLTESPSYLVRVGKIERAKSTIANLTCLPEDHSIVNERVNCLTDESERARSKGQLTLWKILRCPIYRDITKVGILLNTTVVLGGNIVFLDQDKTLLQLRMQLDNEKALILGCLAVGSVLLLTSIQFIDRKLVLAAAFTVLVLALGILAVYTQQDLTVHSLRWVPVVCLGLVVCAYGVLWGLPTIVMTEMLNIEIRLKILTMLFMYSQIVKLIHVTTFQQVEELMGIYTMFYVFAIVNMFGGVYAIFIMPTVRGKTVQQIEKQLKRKPLLTFKTSEIKA